jgi:hypothetical protein
MCVKRSSELPVTAKKPSLFGPVIRLYFTGVAASERMDEQTLMPRSIHVKGSCDQAFGEFKHTFV